MWVYTDEAVRNRLALDRRLGFWVDYWLFLHAEDAYPIWSVRPLGLITIARAALDSDGPEDRVLREQLKREILRAIRLLKFVPHVPAVPSESIQINGSQFTSSWRDWLAAVAELELGTLVAPLIRSISEALLVHDYVTVAFLTRRLASEVGAEEMSATRLFDLIRYVFCNWDAFHDKPFCGPDFVRCLCEILSPPEKTAFIVEASLAPVPFPRTIPRSQVRGVTFTISSTGDHNVLTGIRVEVTAGHAEEAALLSAKTTATIIENLRLAFNVRTHMYGNLTVRGAVSGHTAYVPLPHPFWASGGRRRKIPRLPKKFNVVIRSLPLEERAMWNSAKWHLSQAFSMWPEDAHGAAAHIWQALEAFVPGTGGWKRVLNLAPQFIDRTTLTMAEQLASQIARQVQAFRGVPSEDILWPDWYYWDSHRVDIRKWIGRVLDVRSDYCCSRWTRPAAFDSLFHPSVGTLQIIGRKLLGGEHWMETRLSDDLRLLYGLRNKVAHSGQRILPWQMAMHLGQIGAEVIFTVMGDRSARLQDVKHDPPE